MVSRLQTAHPDSLCLITGDFNHASLSSILPNFTQYVQCPTRGTRTLDLLYANVTEAYSSSPLPPLGNSDHNMVHLRPIYTPMVRKQPPTTRCVRVWSEGAMEALRDCFATTVWDALCQPHGEDIDGLTECISGYINFCVENTVPVKKVRCFSNNKPWMTRDLKALLEQKKRAFRSGDGEELRRVQKTLKGEIRRGKDIYRRKLEQSLEQNNIRDVWRGVNTITGRTTTRGTEQGPKDQQWANELNLFFNRFDSSRPPSPPRHPVQTTALLQPQTPSSSPPPPPSPRTSKSSSPLLQPPHHFTPCQGPSLHCLGEESVTSSRLSFSSAHVRRELRRVRVRKAAGPDGISSRLLRDCADQLCEVVRHIFNLSLSLERVPSLWKTSCLVPVPKTTHPREPNHYRPVALTSHLMKTLERMILKHLRPLAAPTMDPLQFAYRAGIGVEDAVIYLLHRSLSHLENSGCAVRVTFFDFSSAFNTVQPSLLRGKLEGAGVDPSLTAWTIDYLTNRPQYVRLHSCVSDVVVCSTGAPQGTVLSPFLFSLYTSDFRHNTDSCHLQKFSDDTAIVGCVSEGNDLEYKEVIANFVDWCGQNHLRINASKTKELVIDFRRKAATHPPVNIQGLDIETVDSYRYLGVHLNNKLTWTTNTDALYKKGQSRLYLLRRLRSFGVCRATLKTFYDTVVASALLYAVVCWCFSATEKDRSRLNRLVRRASSVLGTQLQTIEEVGERRILAKLESIMDNASHPLHDTVGALSSSFSGRLLQPPSKRERYHRSFLPTAVRLFNSSS